VSVTTKDIARLWECCAPAPVGKGQIKLFIVELNDGRWLAITEDGEREISRSDAAIVRYLYGRAVATD
jgi:hypothetical protein